MERKLRGKKFSKIWVYLVRLPPCLEILENAVSFATGSCQKFKPEVLVECKVPKILLKKGVTGPYYTTYKKDVNTNNNTNRSFRKLHGKINLFL